MDTEQDLLDEDLQDNAPGPEPHDVSAVPLPAAPAAAQAAPAPVTGIDSLKPGWWIRENTPPEPSIDYGRVNAIRDLYNAVPTKEANSAIEMATRLEGILGFDADRKAGVSTTEALRKWAPKMYFNNPGAVSRMIQPPFAPGVTNVGGHELIQTGPNRYQLAPPKLTEETGDIPLRPLVTPEGKILGYGKQTKGGLHAKWNTPEGQAKASSMIQGYNSELRTIDNAIKAAQFAGDSAREAQLQKESDQIRKNLHDLNQSLRSNTATATNAGGIPTVTTKEQYDALPSGAEYLNGKSNRRHRKP